MAVGKEVAGLYHLQLQDSSSNVMFVPHVVHSFSVYKSKLSVLWHMRLGHVSHAVLNKIDTISHDVSYHCNNTCHVCLLAKQCKLTFPSSTSYASANFDLLHVDLWGPYNVQTNHGCKYFLTVVDDHSRATWTFSLTYQTMYLSHFDNLLCLCQNTIWFNCQSSQK